MDKFNECLQFRDETCPYSIMSQLLYNEYMIYIVNWIIIPALIYALVLRQKPAEVIKQPTDQLTDAQKSIHDIQKYHKPPQYQKQLSLVIYYTLLTLTGSQLQSFSLMAVLVALQFPSLAMLALASLLVIGGDIVAFLCLMPAVVLNYPGNRFIALIVFVVSTAYLVAVESVLALEIDMFNLDITKIDPWMIVQHFTAIYRQQLTFENQSPLNQGIYWYFFAEVFSHFKLFFVVMLSLVIYAPIPALNLKLRQAPLIAVIVSMVIYDTMSPSVGSQIFLVSALSLTPYTHVLPYCRITTLSSAIMLVSSLIIQPLMLYIWLRGSGGGNANFLYAGNLVYSVGGVLFVGDLSTSYLKSKWDIHVTNTPQKFQPVVLR